MPAFTVVRSVSLTFRFSSRGGNKSPNSCTPNFALIRKKLHLFALIFEYCTPNFEVVSPSSQLLKCLRRGLIGAQGLVGLLVGIVRLSTPWVAPGANTTAVLPPTANHSARFNASRQPLNDSAQHHRLPVPLYIVPGAEAVPAPRLWSWPWPPQRLRRDLVFRPMFATRQRSERRQLGVTFGRRGFLRGAVAPPEK